MNRRSWRSGFRITTAAAAAFLLGTFLAAGEGGPGSEDVPGIEEMLQAFVEDFRGDPLAREPVTFGIQVGEAEAPQWHVVVAGPEGDGGEARVTLNEGSPPVPSPYYVTDRETLHRIWAGEMAALTAMAKASSRDFAPLDLEVMEGYQPSAADVDHLIRLSFHFWTRGFPEVVRFGDKTLTREVHGANAVVFYYQKGFRSGWFHVERGQHVNEDPKTQVNDFPTLIIVTRGALTAKIGGKIRRLEQGETVFIGPKVTHEFWNDGDVPCEGVLLMFGEGA